MTPLRFRHRLSTALSSRPLPDELRYGGPRLGAPPLGSNIGQYVCVRWLGAMGLLLEHDGSQMLIDPLLSGPAAGRRRGWLPDPATLLRRIERADVVVTTTPDAPAARDGCLVAEQTGAELFRPSGDRSTGPGQMLNEGQHADAGPFHFSFRSISKAGAGALVIDVGGLRILHVGDPRADLPEETPDLMVVSLAQDLDTEGLQALAPQVLIPGDWNDPSVPLDAPPRIKRSVQATDIAETIRRSSPSTELAFLAPLSMLSLRIPGVEDTGEEWTWEQALASFKPSNSSPPNLRKKRGR